MESIDGLAKALEASGLGVWARNSHVGYPLANVLHLLGLVMLVGGIGVLDLRLAGLFRRLPPATLARALIPLAAIGLLILAPSGFVMFSADAKSLIHSQAFQAKLVLIGLALLNVAGFHLLWRRTIGTWAEVVPAPARAMAIASLGLWLGAATLGRLIAYS